MRKTNLFLIIYIFYFSANSFEQEFELPAEDQLYKYYLGYVDNVDTISEGLSTAYEQALNSAISENFGFQAQIQMDSYQDSNNSTVLKRIVQESEIVKLEGFERVRIKHELNKKTGKYSLISVFRYNKKFIEKERHRMTQNRPVKNQTLSEIGSSKLNSSLGYGSLQVLTNPEGVSIYLDDNPYLKSPIKILNQLPPGEYKLKLDHPRYETVTEKIYIHPGELTHVTKTLKPATGRLSIDSTPVNATVYINGKKIGTTPLRDIKHRAGQPFQIRLEHPEAYSMTLNDYVLEKDNYPSEIIELRMKSPSFLKTTPQAEKAQIDRLQPTSMFNSFTQDYYWNLGGFFEMGQSPLSTHNTGLFTLGVEGNLGIQDKIGVSYYSGTVNSLEAKTYFGYSSSIEAANRSKVGIWFWQNSKSSFGFEFENSQYQVSYSHSNALGTSFYTSKSIVSVQGQGLAIRYSDQTRGSHFGYQLGLMKNSISSSQLSGRMSIYFTLYFGIGSER